MENQQQPQAIITKSTKSIGIAVLLALLFGGFGVFYASVIGGIICSIITIILIIIAVITMGFGLILCVIWAVICAIIAGILASSYNKKLLAQAK